MEGYLKKWGGMISRWKLYYCILFDGILIFCKERGGQKKGNINNIYEPKGINYIEGSIHLKIASIILVPDDPLRIIINSGTQEIHLRAANIQEKISWVSALKQSQEQVLQQGVISYEDVDNLARSDNGLSEETKSFFNKEQASRLDQEIAHVWSTQASLDEILSLLLPKFDKNSKFLEYFQKLQETGQNLKKHVTSCIKLIDLEKKRLHMLGRYLDQKSVRLSQVAKSDFTLTPEKGFNFNNKGEDFLYQTKEILNFMNDGQNGDRDDQRLNDTLFESFVEEDDAYYKSYNEQKVSKKHSLIMSSTGGPAKLNRRISMIDKDSLITYLKNYSKMKYNLVSTNPYYQNYEVSSEIVRSKLPVTKDPKEKINILSVLKDAIGKDLTRFAVPVYLNEPLSMLQRLGEQFEYVELLNKANECDDSCERMAYIMAFGYSPYSSTINRGQKPFNPLLGETFEFVDEERNFRFFSEQVSHHPPISAGYCENSIFKFWANTNLKTSLGLTSLTAIPLGHTHVILKKWDDHFYFTKGKTTVNIIGTIYADHHGEMVYKNKSTGDIGILRLKQRGWGGKGAFETTGEIRDSRGVERFKLEGRWNQSLDLINISTGERRQIWRRTEIPAGNEYYYNFPSFTMQLNHLNTHLLKHIAPTDSRLRPDQRALECQNLKLAESEKLRLEDKQRARRKEYATIGKIHYPRWFEEKIGEGGEKEYIYLGGYWEAREKGDFEDLLDIY